ncbi:hypothetical protein GWN15_32345, partial [candidate division KSB1 bacterium]|nr:hypothetical protein [candidate division KSB1 bacterium]NIU91040.1 hypothetical protein [candidate division KSB1 bacterium]NIW73490.1 hypothetical protein [candidate division KSB1 bacterium]
LAGLLSMTQRSSIEDEVKKEWGLDKAEARLKLLTAQANDLENKLKEFYEGPNNFWNSDQHPDKGSR